LKTEWLFEGLQHPLDRAESNYDLKHPSVLSLLGLEYERALFNNLKSSFP